MLADRRCLETRLSPGARRAAQSSGGCAQDPGRHQSCILYSERPQSGIFRERPARSGLLRGASEGHVVELLESHHGVGLRVELLPRDHLLHDLAEDVPRVTMLRLELRRNTEQLACLGLGLGLGLGVGVRC